MAKNDKQAKNESRRDFLRVSSFAAAGLVLTPLVAACGGEEEGGRRPSRGGRGGSTTKKKDDKADKKPSGGNGKLQLVDSADAVGARGSLKLTTKAKNDPGVKYLELAANATNIKEASAVNGGSGPYDDSYVVVNAAGGKGVADVVVEVVPSGGKALKFQGNGAVGVNANFRFTRAMVIGTKQKASYEVHDQVLHNINVKKQGRQLFDGQGNAANTAPQPELVESSALPVAGSYEVACSMHTWEKGFVYAFDHNYVGVTTNPHDKDETPASLGWGHSWDTRQGSKDEANYGVVEIADIPVGTHKVNLWHEGAVVDSFDIEITEGVTAEATRDL